MEINGEDLTDTQVEFYRRTFKNDCVKVAGEFHNMNRSKKFRANWPNEYDYADANWKTFVEAVRALYAQQLASPHVPEDKKETIHRCLVIDTMTNAALEAACIEGDTSLQIAPGSQQFAGDRKENAGISDNYGDRPERIKNAFRKALLNTGSRFH